MTPKIPTFITAASLVLVGLSLGFALALNWNRLTNIFPEINISITPKATPQKEGGCEPRTFVSVGLTVCLPKSWVIKSEEGPKKLLLEKLVLQSPDFDEITDTTLEGFPTVSINRGNQLSISVSRITPASNIATFSALTQFWQINRVGHAISREEVLEVSSQPALYHVLTGTKSGSHIDTHIIKFPFLYDLNYYYNGQNSTTGEDAYRAMLGSLMFNDLDPKMTLSDQIKIEIPKPASLSSSRKPITILVTTSKLEISSQAELPTIISQNASGGPSTILGTALPEIASDSSGLTSANSFTFTWLSPASGTYNLTAEIVKNNGEIYDSKPLRVSVGDQKTPRLPTPPTDVLPEG